MTPEWKWVFRLDEKLILVIRVKKKHLIFEVFIWCDLKMCVSITMRLIIKILIAKIIMTVIMIMTIDIAKIIRTIEMIIKLTISTTITMIMVLLTIKRNSNNNDN